MTVKVQLKREVDGVKQNVNPITSDECVVLQDGKKLSELSIATVENFVEENIIVEENLVDRVESIEEQLDSEFEKQNNKISEGLSNIEGVEQRIVNKVDTEINKTNAQLSVIKLLETHTTPELYGAKGDGVTDDTSAIQECINKNGNIVFSKSKTYMVNAVVGITIGDNKKIDLNGATLKTIPNDSKFYNVLKLTGTNIVLSNGYLVGDREHHMFNGKVWRQWEKSMQINTGEIMYTPAGYGYECIRAGITSNDHYPAGTGANVIDGSATFKFIGDSETTVGEWGNGIGITGNNIEVNDISCNDFWGDGLYTIGSPRNVTINNYKADNNRRQGISVIGCDGLVINNPFITNTNGVEPQSGIDIEPEGSQEIIALVINNPITKNNAGAGIQLFHGGVDSKSTIDIVINNHQDYGSLYGFYTGEQNEKEYFGLCRLNNPYYKNNKAEGVKIVGNYYKSIPIEIYNPIIDNPNAESGIIVDTFTPSGVAITCGNIHIYNAKVNDYKVNKTVKYIAKCMGGATNNLLNLSFINPLPCSFDFDVTKGICMFFNIDNFKILDTNTTMKILIDDSFDGNEYFIQSRSYFSEVEVTKDVDFTFILDFENETFKLPNNTKIKFINNSDNKRLQIVKSGTTYLPLGRGVSGGIFSQSKGSSLTLTKVSNGVWMIENMVGTWEIY